MIAGSWTETSIDIYQTTRTHSSADTFHIHRCENLKSYIPDHLVT